MDSVSGPNLVAVDKGEVERRIPIDDKLATIIEEAIAFRRSLESIPPEKRKGAIHPSALFLNLNGRAWNRMTLLHAAQRGWVRAGLEKKKIHEIRHTLGTLAGKDFSAGMVQAAMGHRSRKSAEAYFHPNEEMAAEVRQKIVTKLYQRSGKGGKNSLVSSKLVNAQNGEFQCPCCSHNLLIINKKTRKPLRLAGYDILERAKGIEPS